MSQQIYAVDLNLGGNQLLGCKLENLSADPTGADLYAGRVWFNTSTHVVKYYDGTAVVALGTGTGTVTSVTAGDSTITIAGTAGDPTVRVAKVLDHTWITDFDTQVRTSTLNQLAPPTADLSLNSHKLTSVTDPTNAQDASTKAYTDAVAAGQTATWPAVRAASTAALTLSGTQTVDGVALVAGDRVLVKDQGTGSQNGLYSVAAGAWSRTTDADTSAEVIAGKTVWVNEGTVNRGSLWMLSTDNPITLGTTALVFAQRSGLGDITVSAPLVKTGNVLSAPNVPSRYAVNVPAASPATINHALGTTDVLVQVQELTGSKRVVVCEVDITDANNVTLAFNTTPTSGQYRCVVMG